MAGFISQKIEVEYQQEPGRRVPLSFFWDHKTFEIREIISSWEDHGLPAARLKRPHWWQRRHRVHYLVQTREGSMYEIYWDRGSKKKEWVLYMEV
jgi:hypothetical protein